MAINRRNVLAGLGGLAVGGGALLGSGAFSSVEAQRSVEVNVVNQTNIAEDFVDIILEDVDSHSDLGLDSASSPTDPTGLFPTSSDTYGDSGYSPDDDDVSLMENDVTIIYGIDGNKLPPNSAVDYNSHFTVVNDSGSTAESFAVDFSTGRSDLLTDQTGTNTFSSGTVGAGNTQSLDVTLNTGSSSTESDTLTLTITNP